MAEYDDIPEVTPGWLKALLKKYDQDEGVLAGLPDYFLSGEDDDAADDISGVLDDIAADVPDLDEDRLASSVDWGVSTEDESPAAPTDDISAVDDLLTSFQEPETEASTDFDDADDSDDWLTGLSVAPSEPEPTIPDPDPDDTLDESPDWLAELSLTEPESEAESVSAPQDEEEETPSSGLASADDVPDWLENLGNTEPTASTEAEQSVDEAEEGLDWLSEMRASASDSVDDVTEVPDWIAEFAAEDDKPAADQTPEQPPADDSPFQTEVEPSSDFLEYQEAPTSGVEIPEWLSEFDATQSAEEEPAAEVTPQAEEPAAPLEEALTEDDGDLDWMSELGLDAETEEPAAPMEAAAPPVSAPQVETETDDLDAAWLAELARHYPNDPEAEITSAESASLDDDEEDEDFSAAAFGLEEIPEWLQSSLDSTDDEDDSDTISEATTLPNWLTDNESEEDDLEDDMGSVLASEPDAEELDLEFSFESAEDDGPDWLSSIEVSPVEAESADEEEEEAPESDWLSELRIGATAVDEEDDYQASEDDEGDDSAEESDWLSELEIGSSSETTSVSESADSGLFDPEDEEDDAPDWLLGLQTSSETETPVSETDRPESLMQEADEDVPDWPADMATETTEDTSTTDEDEATVSISESTSDEAPDWLTDLEIDTPETESPPMASEESDWLAEAELESSAAVPDAELPGFPEGDEVGVPDWLAEIEAVTPDADIEVPSSEASAAPPIEEESEAVEDKDSLFSTEPQSAIEVDQPSAEELFSEPDDEIEIEREDTAVVSPIAAAAAASITSDDTTLDEEDATPDWLAELEAEAATARDESSFVAFAEPESGSETPAAVEPEPTEDEAPPQTLEVAEVEPPIDQAPSESEPEPESESLDVQAQMPEIPDWMAIPDEESAVAEPTVTDEPTSPEEAAAEAQSIDEVPDWLTADDEPEEPEEPEISTSRAESATDWLNNLRSGVDAFEEEESEAEVAELPGEPTPDEAGVSEAAMTAEAPVDIGELPPEVPDQDPSIPVSSELETAVPDWMQDLEEETSESAQMATDTDEDDEIALADDVPDWMKDLAEESPQDAGAAPLETDEDDAPDWLSSLRAGAAVEEDVAEEDVTDEAADTIEDVPAWMSDLETQEPQAPEAEAPAPLEDDQDDAPDWLSNLRIEASEGEAFEAETEAEEDVPDWMDAMLGQTSEPPAPEAQETDTDTEHDWLSGLPIDEEETERVSDSDEDLPDWMQGLELGRESDPIQDVAASGSAEAEALDTTSEEADISPTEITEEPDSLTEMPDIPDWMMSPEDDSPDQEMAADSDAEDIAEEDTAEEDSGESVSRLSDLLQSSPADTADTEDDESETATTNLSDSLFDWMDESSSEEDDDLAFPWLTETDTKIDDLFSTDTDDTDDTLPWLTVDDDDDDDDDNDDDQGPGAGQGSGLGGTPDIPSAPDNTLAFDQSEEESTSLDATGTALSGDVAQLDYDPTHDRIFVDQESPAPPPTPSAEVSTGAARKFFDIATGVPGTPTLPRQQAAELNLAKQAAAVVLRIIFLVLIVIPLFYHFDRGGFPFPWLEPSPEEQQLIRNELQGVLGDKQPGSVALLSFDYTPATEGEMDPLAMEVVSKLRGQGLRILAVSLEPEGPAVIQSVFDRTSAEDYGIDVLNLGYYPGGPLAVRRLAYGDLLANAMDVQTGTAYRDLAAWVDVVDINDIALIVSISAKPDTARWWAEQLEDAAGPPKLAVASAAAEPFVLPYVASGQYQSVIAGINGAAALESARVQERLGPATAMLDSQSVAHLLIMVLMLAGTVAGLFRKYGQVAAA